MTLFMLGWFFRMACWCYVVFHAKFWDVLFVDVVFPSAGVRPTGCSFGNCEPVFDSLGAVHVISRVFGVMFGDTSIGGGVHVCHARATSSGRRSWWFFFDYINCGVRLVCRQHSLLLLLSSSSSSSSSFFVAAVSLSFLCSFLVV